MTYVLVITGGIGSGKSEVCRILSELGYTVQYNADRRVKDLYVDHPTLLSSVEDALGASLRSGDGVFQPGRLSEIIFSDRTALDKVESLVFPVLKEDFLSFAAEHKEEKIIIFESATILDKPYFDGFGDFTILVDAPYSIRLERACSRDGVSAEAVEARMRNQKPMNGNPRIDAVIMNDSGLDELKVRTSEAISHLTNKIEKMKTDLTKILSISGQSGLYLYISATRQGAVVEALADKKRTAVSATSKITSLADISIYTDDEEVKLQDVLLSMKEVLGDADAPSAKSKPEELKALFEKALPAYDRDRFYVSHMKKVVAWYNALKNYASLDFVNPEEETSEENEEA